MGVSLPRSTSEPVETEFLDGLDESLLRLRRVFQRPGYRKRLLEGLSSDIGSASLRLLRAVQRADEAPSVGGVADVLMIDASTASRMVEGAAAAGLLERRSCAEDRRKVRLHLTAEGREVLEQVTVRRRQLLAQVTAEWDPDDLRELIGLLSTLQAGFDQLERNP